MASKRNNRALRLNTLALFLCLSLALAHASYAADPGLRNRIEKDTRLFSIEVRDAETSDVLRALAQQSGFNIILGEGVEGKLSLSFTDIAFRDALEIIISASGLTYTIRNNVFWVGKKVDLSGEIAMEVVKLNYADPTSASTQLKGTLSEHGAAFPDLRTGSIILRDLPGKIEDAKKILKAIDVQPTQVMIEARIVEATASFSRQLGVQWGGQWAAGRSSATGSSLLPASSGGRNFAVNLPAAAPTSGLGIIIGSISSKILLDLELSAAESKGDLRIVSRPKISTMNNKPASIHSGLTFRVKLTQNLTTGAAATAAATTTSGLEEIKTGIDLTVTPQISSDDFILLDISTNKSDPDYTHTVDGIPGVSEKSASTHVLVKDGDTVVIGGLYKTIASEQDDSVPWFSKIPILGSLFSHTSKSTQDEELLVFITPRIMRQGQTGNLN